MEALQTVAPAVWRHGAQIPGSCRAIPEEAGVALTYDRATYAVMMATPADLEDFGIGFSLTEGVVDDAAHVTDLELVEQPDGIEVRMSLEPGQGDALIGRRRKLAGPTGCGLCGIDSLREASRPARIVRSDASFTAAQIAAALATLSPAQALNRQVRGVHAAGFWRPGEGLVAVREDVGRHNALDKLVGALARTGCATADGVLLLSSRVSIEMVQKAAVLGAPVLVAVSAPTAHAMRLADAAGMTLIAIAREDGFEVFTQGWRVAEADGAQGEARLWSVSRRGAKPAEPGHRRTE